MQPGPATTRHIIAPSRHHCWYARLTNRHWSMATESVITSTPASAAAASTHQEHSHEDAYQSGRPHTMHTKCIHIHFYLVQNHKTRYYKTHDKTTRACGTEVCYYICSGMTSYITTITCRRQACIIIDCPNKHGHGRRYYSVRLPHHRRTRVPGDVIARRRSSCRERRSASGRVIGVSVHPIHPLAVMKVTLRHRKLEPLSARL